MLWLVLCGLLATMTMSATAQRQSADRRTWYQAYQDGRAQVQKGDWQAAIASLTIAKNTGPKPGRRVPFYGDVYDDFLPDYFLALAYLNAGRPQEAADAFATVQQSGLITQKDREYATFLDQQKLASARLAASREPQVAQQSPPTTQAPPAAGATQTAANTATLAPVDVIDAGNPNASNDARAGTTAAAPDNRVPATTARTPASDKAPSTRTPATKGPTPTATIVDRNPVRPSSADVPSRTAQQLEAMTAFYSGDYRVAADLFTALATTRSATRRDEFYLACSYAALARLGQADRTTLDDARERFARVDGSEFSADVRLLSPSILSLLRSRPTQ